MLFLGSQSAPPAPSFGGLRALLGAAGALGLVGAVMDVRGACFPAAVPLNALQAVAFGALPRSSPRHGQLGGQHGHFRVT